MGKLASTQIRVRATDTPSSTLGEAPSSWTWEALRRTGTEHTAPGPCFRRCALKSPCPGEGKLRVGTASSLCAISSPNRLQQHPPGHAAVRRPSLRRTLKAMASAGGREGHQRPSTQSSRGLVQSPGFLSAPIYLGFLPMGEPRQSTGAGISRLPLGVSLLEAGPEAPNAGHT